MCCAGFAVGFDYIVPLEYRGFDAAIESGRFVAPAFDINMVCTDVVLPALLTNGIVARELRASVVRLPSIEIAVESEDRLAPVPGIMVVYNDVTPALSTSEMVVKELRATVVRVSISPSNLLTQVSSLESFLGSLECRS